MEAHAFRRLGAADKEAVQAFVRGLSLQSRRERFFAPVAELTPGQLERLVAGPGLSIAAWEGGRIVGLGQYALEAGEAEFAVVVADEWRGRGLGEALMQAIVTDARRSGVKVLGGLTLLGNRAMRALAAKFGFALRADADPALLRMERVLA